MTASGDDRYSLWLRYVGYSVGVRLGGCKVGKWGHENETLLKWHSD
jgi:hypothetical protein